MAAVCDFAPAHPPRAEYGSTPDGSNRAASVPGSPATAITRREGVEARSGVCGLHSASSHNAQQSCQGSPMLCERWPTLPCDTEWIGLPLDFAMSTQRTHCSLRIWR